MTLLHLKPLTADVLPAVLALDHRCFGGLWTQEGYERELDSPNSELLILQPAANNCPPDVVGLGCLWAIVDEAHITLLAVDPRYQRRGLGQVMLLALLTQAQRRNLARATLEVRVSNQAALALYEKFGFQEAGRRKRYYQDTGEDALILWRGGLQDPSFLELLQSWDQDLRIRLNQQGWTWETTL